MAGFLVRPRRTEITRRSQEGITDALSGPIRVAGPEESGEAGCLGSGGAGAAEGTWTPKAGEGNRGDNVGLGTHHSGPARAVIDAVSLGVHGADGEDFGAVAGEGYATSCGGITQAAAKRDEMKVPRHSSSLMQPDHTSSSNLRLEPYHSALPRHAWLRQ